MRPFAQRSVLGTRFKRGEQEMSDCLWLQSILWHWIVVVTTSTTLEDIWWAIEIWEFLSVLEVTIVNVPPSLHIWSTTPLHDRHFVRVMQRLFVRIVLFPNFCYHGRMLCAIIHKVQPFSNDSVDLSNGKGPSLNINIYAIKFWWWIFLFFVHYIVYWTYQHFRHT